jgi:hypothetical protein
VKLKLQTSILALVVALAAAGAVPAHAETSFGVRAGTMLGFGVQLRHDFHEKDMAGGFWGVRGTAEGISTGASFSFLSLSTDVTYQIQRSSESAGFYLGFGGRYITGSLFNSSASTVAIGEFFMGFESPASPGGSFFAEVYPLLFLYSSSPFGGFQVITLPYVFSLGWTVSF